MIKAIPIIYEENSMTNKITKISDKSILHIHPFEEFIFAETKTLILGTFPGRDYTNPETKNETDDWYYGNKRNKFWNLLEYALGYDENSLNTKAIKQEILRKHNLGITDIVQSAYRINNNNDDGSLKIEKVRNLNKTLKDYPNIKTIILTSKAMYKDFFTKNYVNCSNAVLQNDRMEIKIYQGEKINLYYYTFNNRRILVIPLYTPTYRGKISFETKKKIYKQVLISVACYFNKKAV